MTCAASSAFMYVNFGTLGDTVSCVLNSIVDLGRQTLTDATSSGVPNPVYGTSTASQLNALDTDIVATIDEYIAWLPIVAIVPACITAVLVLLATLCGCRAGNTACCAKLFILVGMLLSFLCVILYGIIGAAGTLTEQDTAKQQISTATALCAIEPITPEQLNNATAYIAYGESQGQNMDAEKLQLRGMQEALRIFQSLCVCVTIGFFDDIKALSLPGLVCCAASLYTFVVQACLCCALGCCGSPKKKLGGGNGKPSFSQNV